MSDKTIFISYCHKDEKLKDCVQQYLEAVDMGEVLQVWEDRQIEAGADWYQKIQDAMATAKLAILLISVDFLNSKFIKREEIPALLQYQKERGLRIIPFILRNCPWMGQPWLAIPQVRPIDGKPLNSFSESDQETQLTKFAEEIAKIIQGREPDDDRQDDSQFVTKPTAAQSRSRSVLQAARERKESGVTKTANRYLDQSDIVRCDLTRQVTGFLPNLQPLGSCAFSLGGNFSLVREYIVERFRWELMEQYRRNVQLREMHVYPEIVRGNQGQFLSQELMRLHSGYQPAEVFNEKQTDYLFLIWLHNIPPIEIKRGAQLAWEELRQSVDGKLQQNRSRLVALWINTDKEPLDMFFMLPYLERFDRVDVVEYFRGVLQRNHVPDQLVEQLLEELWRHDGYLPGTYQLMCRIVKDLARGVIT